MEQNTNKMTNWRDLFSLYRSLVGPFQEFENRSYRKRAIELEAGSAQGTISAGYKRTILEAFWNTLKWAIPFLIVFYVIVNVVHVNGEKLFSYYSELTDPVGEIYEAMFYKEDFNIIGDLIFGIVTLFIFGAVIPCLIFLFPLIVVGSVISRAHRISQAKTTLKTCEELLPQAETAVQEAWKRIAPHVKNIPPNYRNSCALAFFSDSFFNFKVQNLQEAVNLYDQYLHQQRMEQSQREIAEAQRETMAAIDALSEQMDDIQAQIDSIEPEVNYYYY